MMEDLPSDYVERERYRTEQHERHVQPYVWNVRSNHRNTVKVSDRQYTLIPERRAWESTLVVR
jgi:hypothetical protein